jgi:hypothetical protein
VIDVVKMRYDGSHSPLVASDPANGVRHDANVRREALAAFLGNAFAVQTELFKDNGGYDEFHQLLLDHFLDGRLRRAPVSGPSQGQATHHVSINILNMELTLYFCPFPSDRPADAK